MNSAKRFPFDAGMIIVRPGETSGSRTRYPWWADAPRGVVSSTTGYRSAVSSVELVPESLLRSGVDLLVRLVEAAGALVIFVGAAWAFVSFVRAGFARDSDARRKFVAIRLSLGRFLALGLEFQLAGDVLRTAIAPSFAEIGQLAAIAAIRTALNYFLAKEIREERAEIAQQDPTAPAPP